MSFKPFSFNEVPMQARCRWFVRRGTTTHYDRGFRAKGDASNWVDAMGCRLEWRSGFAFKLRGDDVEMHIVDRQGNRADAIKPANFKA